MCRKKAERVVRARGVAKAALGTAADGVDPVLLSAASLFEERGYDRATIGAIAERAGVSRQHVQGIYRGRHGAKESILAAIVIEFCRTFVDHLLEWEGPVPFGGDAGAGRDGRAAGGFGVLVGAAADYLRSRGALARIALASRPLPWLAVSTRAAWRKVERRVVELVPEAGSSTASASAVLECMRVALIRGPAVESGCDVDLERDTPPAGFLAALPDRPQPDASDGTCASPAAGVATSAQVGDTLSPKPDTLSPKCDTLSPGSGASSSPSRRRRKEG